jgi:hypothetical protein
MLLRSELTDHRHPVQILLCMIIICLGAEDICEHGVSEGTQRDRWLKKLA